MCKWRYTTLVNPPFYISIRNDNVMSCYMTHGHIYSGVAPLKDKLSSADFRQNLRSHQPSDQNSIKLCYMNVKRKNFVAAIFERGEPRHCF